MGKVIPFPDRPQQPLHRQLALSPAVIRFLEEAVGADLRPAFEPNGDGRVGATEAFALMRSITGSTVGGADRVQAAGD